MVNNRLRAKLRQAEETRPAQKAVAADLLAARREKGHEWQAGEVIAWQEPLTGQIPVGIEVGVEGAAAFQQQVMLDTGFVIALFCLSALLFSDGVIHLNGVGILHLARGGPEQGAPAVKGLLEM